MTTDVNTILVLRLAQLSHEGAFILYLVHLGSNFAMRSVDIPLPMNSTSTDSLNSGLPEAYFYRLAPTWLTHSLSSSTYAMRSLDLPPMVDSGLSNSQRHRRAGWWSYSPLTFFAWLQNTCFKRKKTFRFTDVLWIATNPPASTPKSTTSLYSTLSKGPQFLRCRPPPQIISPPSFETGG